MDEIIFFAPLPALRKRTRLSKMAACILAQDYRIRFFGWERERGEAAEFASDDDRISEATILRGGGYASSRARLLYPLWMAAVFFRVLRLGRGRTIFALGWETAFPAVLAAWLTRSRIVFDDADRFSMIFRLPGPLHRGLQRLEEWTSRRAAMHVIPGFSRYEWRHDDMVILRNSPLEADFAQARRAAPPRPPHKVVLYANGWIGETRGAPVFLKLLDLADERGIDLHLLIAGRVSGEAAPRLIGHHRVTYLGEVPQRDALACYAVADAVLTYYDPAIIINRKAESNKWGDAVFFGCPIIVNTEVETARPFLQAGGAWAVPYEDADALAALAQRIGDDAGMREAASAALRTLLPDYPVFDTQLKSILDLMPDRPKGRQ